MRQSRQTLISVCCRKGNLNLTSNKSTCKLICSKPKSHFELKSQLFHLNFQLLVFHSSLFTFHSSLSVLSFQFSTFNSTFYILHFQFFYTILPSSIIIIRSVRLAKSSSWVTTSNERFCSVASSRKISKTMLVFLLSKLPVGSSPMIIVG